MSITLQMTLSYLIPGAAEGLEKKASGNSNLAWTEAAVGIKNFRNALYVSTALSAIAFIGALRTTGTKFYALATVTILSGLVADRAFKRMYEVVAGYIIPQLDRE